MVKLKLLKMELVYIQISVTGTLFAGFPESEKQFLYQFKE